MDKWLGRDGKLSQIMEGFEFREGQINMADSVLNTLQNGGALLVEAGTGTGKTLGYLAPAVLSGKKVVVSTGTKNLQEQIVSKDIPIVLELFPEANLKTASMKGRGNYLCKRRFRNFAQQYLFSDSEEGKIFEAIQAWAQTTITGDRAELDTLPDDYEKWSEINSKSELCLGTGCPHYEACYITKMRSDAAEADLVIVNHHLLFADLNIRDNSFGEVIPGYDAVVLDEAHLVEETATAYFGLSISNHRFAEAVRDTERELGAAGLDDNDSATILAGLHKRSRALFDYLRGGAEGRRGLKREDVQGAITFAKELINTLTLLSDYLLSIKDSPDTIKALAHRYTDMAEIVTEILSMENDDNVYWVETRGRGVFLQSSPIDVSDHLAEKLYPRSDAVVMTSATLASAGDFSFIKTRLGLEEPEEMVIESPFNYSEQAICYIPGDLPEPRDSLFVTHASERIETILKLSNGRAFVLFTSKSNLEQCWERLKDKLEYTVFKQGDRPRSVILDQFRKDTHSVLFATTSFWQGG